MTISSSLVKSVEKLKEILPADSVVCDADIMEKYRFDRSDCAEAGRPLAVVRPSSTQEVQIALGWASENQVPVITRGAGSGLSGGAVAIDGCITLSTERMRQIEIDVPGRLAIAQAGALNVDVKSAARAHNLWYPPDPSSFEICSIGGNAATNAGGLCCVKYGVTGDYVMELEVVLADGRVLRLGGRTIKNVAGYDLKRLFVGSEGTLGVITEVVLRLKSSPPPPTTIVAVFKEAEDAGRAVASIALGACPSVLELMDRAALRAVDQQFHMGLGESGALVLGQSDAGGEQGAAEVALMTAACQAAGSEEVYSTQDEDEGSQLMAARRLALPAVEKLGTVLIEDVGVPLGRICELLGGIEQIAERRKTLIATVGHAGDGNFHPLIVFDRNDSVAIANADGAFADVMSLGLSLGGTISGEHGVGSLKVPWLERQLGSDVLDVMHDVKKALDPFGILNPGRAV